MTDERFLEMMIDRAVKAYIQVYGENKWLSLSEAEKNQVVHTVVMDFCHLCLAK